MNARNDVKRPSDQSLDARRVLAAAQLRFAARVDFFVAGWLERCATKVEAAPRLFKTDRPRRRDAGRTDNGPDDGRATVDGWHGSMKPERRRTIMGVG